MALSLADELAAFDDAQGAGGISLAEEFGLDLDIGEQNGECSSDYVISRTEISNM